MSNLHQLFGIPKWKSPRQQEVEAQYLAQSIDLEPVFYEAHDLTLANTTDLDHRGRGFMSQAMNGHIIGLLRRLYPDRMTQEEYNRWYFQLNKETRIYFKKLDKRYRPNNIPTKHVAELNSGELLFKADPITVLYGGFRLKEDKLWDRLRGCYLLEMLDGRPHWVSDLGDLAADMASPAVPVIPVSPIAPDVLLGEIEVNIKTATEGGRTAESTDQ
jgi:hypothetical protein